jgi:hypothetical protein
MSREAWTNVPVNSSELLLGLTGDEVKKHLSLYHHDCPNCIYLGPYLDEARLADLYVHLAHDDKDAFIIRYSDTLDDYGCLTRDVFKDGYDPAKYREIRRRAESMGF